MTGVVVEASRRMLALALRLGPTGLDGMSDDDVESILLGELYARFPNYSPDVDGNGYVTWTIVRRRRYELVTGGPSLNHIMKGVYSEDYIESLTFKDHPLFALFSKRYPTAAKVLS